VESFPLTSNEKQAVKTRDRLPKTVVLNIPAGFTSPPQELGLVAFKNDICFAFLHDNFVWRTYGTPWLQMAIEGKMDNLSFQSGQALSQMSFGSF
jgi:hypothetical protein